MREEGDRLLLIRQVDHSMLSGWLAAMWGAGPWERPQPYSSCVVAARLHDLIWVPWDEALPRRPDGRPYNFREVPRQVIVPYQQRGIDAVEALDPYAGLLVSLHFSGFYRSQWGWESGQVDAADRVAFRAFAFALPALVAAAYFLVLALYGGIWWPIHFWAGAISLAGGTGWLLSFLALPARSEGLILTVDASSKPGFGGAGGRT